MTNSRISKYREEKEKKVRDLFLMDVSDAGNGIKGQIMVNSSVGLTKSEYYIPSYHTETKKIIDGMSRKELSDLVCSRLGDEFRVIRKRSKSGGTHIIIEWESYDFIGNIEDNFYKQTSWMSFQNNRALNETIPELVDTLIDKYIDPILKKYPNDNKLEIQLPRSSANHTFGNRGMGEIVSVTNFKKGSTNHNGYIINAFLRDSWKNKRILKKLIKEKLGSGFKVKISDFYDDESDRGYIYTIILKWK